MDHGAFVFDSWEATFSMASDPSRASSTLIVAVPCLGKVFRVMNCLAWGSMCSSCMISKMPFLVEPRTSNIVGAGVRVLRRVDHIEAMLCPFLEVRMTILGLVSLRRDVMDAVVNTL